MDDDENFRIKLKLRQRYSCRGEQQTNKIQHKKKYD